MHVVTSGYPSNMHRDTHVSTRTQRVLNQVGFTGSSEFANENTTTQSAREEYITDSSAPGQTRRRCAWLRGCCPGVSRIARSRKNWILRVWHEDTDPGLGHWDQDDASMQACPNGFVRMRNHTILYNLKSYVDSHMVAMNFPARLSHPVTILHIHFRI